VLDRFPRADLKRKGKRDSGSQLMTVEKRQIRLEEKSEWGVEKDLRKKSTTISHQFWGRYSGFNRFEKKKGRKQ